MMFIHSVLLKGQEGWGNGSVKQLSYKHKDLSWDLQNPCKAGVKVGVRHIFNSSSPRKRWVVGTEFLEARALRPSSLVTKTPCFKQGQKSGPGIVCVLASVHTVQSPLKDTYIF